MFVEKSYADMINDCDAENVEADPEEIKNRISNKLAEIGSRKED